MPAGDCAGECSRLLKLAAALLLMEQAVAYEDKTTWGGRASTTDPVAAVAAAAAAAAATVIFTISSLLFNISTCSVILSSPIPLSSSLYLYLCLCLSSLLSSVSPPLCLYSAVHFLIFSQHALSLSPFLHHTNPFTHPSSITHISFSITILLTGLGCHQRANAGTQRKHRCHHKQR